MNIILLVDSSLKTLDIKSHLLTHTIKGIRKLFLRHPSGIGIYTL